MTKLNKVVVVLDEKAINEIANGKVDNRVNNTGRPVNKKSARQVRLAKQAHYNNVNTLFVTGNSFKVKNDTYTYKPSNDNTDALGCIVSNLTGYVCNVEYIGRTKVKCFTFVLGKQVKVELNLKTLQFVS
jgi:hypothetical protein